MPQGHPLSAPEARLCGLDEVPVEPVQELLTEAPVLSGQRQEQTADTLIVARGEEPLVYVRLGVVDDIRHFYWTGMIPRESKWLLDGVGQGDAQGLAPEQHAGRTRR
jgi:hypothetical protein